MSDPFKTITIVQQILRREIERRRKDPSYDWSQAYSNVSRILANMKNLQKYEENLTFILGPMTGYEDYNFLTFDTEAKRLREEGYEVLCPSELSGRVTTESWETYMRRDIHALTHCTSFHALPGWINSKGAKVEHDIAHMLKMEEKNK